MKPTWDKAPEWAQWLAMDQDQTWTWYEDYPEQDDIYDECWFPKGFSKYQVASVDETWKDTLEPRPSSRGQEDGLVWEDVGTNEFGNQIWRTDSEKFEFQIIGYIDGEFKLICHAKQIKRELYNDLKSLDEAKAMAQKWLEENR